jgi:hypothetical protein
MNIPYKATCNERPPAISDHFFVALGGVVSQDRIHCITYVAKRGFIFLAGYATINLQMDRVAFTRAWNEKMVACRRTVQRIDSEPST